MASGRGTYILRITFSLQLRHGGWSVQREFNGFHKPSLRKESRLAEYGEEGTDLSPHICKALGLMRSKTHTWTNVLKAFVDDLARILLPSSHTCIHARMY
jgi:hypothetical protein